MKQKRRFLFWELNPQVSYSELLFLAAKRVFDLCASGLCLILTSPLYLCLWIAVKIEDGGPAIFSQERIGRNAKPFTLYKFRSMKINAEDVGTAQLCCGAEDPRLTKVGRFIREHHIDEMPQLWNIFIGDMSFVGYRPERRFYINMIMERNPDYVRLFVMRPGTFSYATLYNGYTDTIEKMLRRLDMDLDYLDHHSVATDVEIMAKTVFFIVTGKKF